MSDQRSLFASVSAHEGFEAHPYKDTRNLWTFGKGHCLETNPLSGADWRYLLENGHLAAAITQAGADWLMQKELDDVEAQCARMFDFWPKLSAARQNALIEMTYQMGMPKLCGFHKMLAAIEAGDWQTAHDEALDSDWAKQTPARARELAELLRSGEFT